MHWENVEFIIDVDGDGVMEIVLETQYYEGQGFYLYQ